MVPDAMPGPEAAGKIFGGKRISDRAVRRRPLKPGPVVQPAGVGPVSPCLGAGKALPKRAGIAKLSLTERPKMPPFSE
jgi:hypothetical protein